VHQKLINGKGLTVAEDNKSRDYLLSLTSS